MANYITDSAAVIGASSYSPRCPNTIGSVALHRERWTSGVRRSARGVYCRVFATTAPHPHYPQEMSARIGQRQRPLKTTLQREIYQLELSIQSLIEVLPGDLQTRSA